MRVVLPMASVLGVIIVPIVIICSILTNPFFDASFYHAGQVKYNVQATTGMSMAQIDRVDQGIIRFFADNESLPTALGAVGAQSDVFKQKEILHMNDVRVLVRFIARAEVVGLVAFGILTGFCIWKRAAGGLNVLSRALTIGSALTLGLVVVAGVLTYTSFDALFLTFHEVTFQNNFWELDPRTDHLIQMFPFGFWYDAMLTIALRVLIVTVILGGCGIILRRVQRRQA